MIGDVVVYGVPDDPNNGVAIEKLRTIPWINARFVMCPPSVREAFRVPLIDTWDSGRFFGIESILKFVDRLASRGKGKPMTAEQKVDKIIEEVRHIDVRYMTDAELKIMNIVFDKTATPTEKESNDNHSQ